MAEAYLEQNDNNKAIEMINTGLSSEPGNPELYFILARIHLAKKDSRSAINALEKAIDIDDSKASYNLLLADIILDTGKRDDATFYYETAVLYAPENVDALFKLGKLYLEDKKVDYAFRHLSRATLLAPGRSDIKTVYEEAKRTRGEINATREPVEFNYIEFGKVDLRYRESFNSSNFGSVTIFNTRNEPISDILIEITCPDLISLPILITVPLMDANQFLENYFDFKLDDNLIGNIAKSKSRTNLNFKMIYNYAGKEKVLDKTEDLQIIQ